ncbi:hypothetical protein B0H15DRAFT_737943, partial [Mycena belliarum]
DKSCFHCHVTSTPLWRREPATGRTLCNACGLYLQQRHALRPQALIDADLPPSPDDVDYVVPDAEYAGPICSHCGTRRTSVWRRDTSASSNASKGSNGREGKAGEAGAGARVCNACGVYKRLRGRERPLALRRNRIKPR